MTIKNIIYIGSSSEGMRSKGIYYDLMQEFVLNGHNVYCIYAEEKRNKKNTHMFFENGINYLGVKTGNLNKNPNLISKAYVTLSIDQHYINAIKKYFSDIEFDLVLYSTPPITFLKTVTFLKQKGAIIYLMLKDIFPQNAVDLGMFPKDGLIHNFFRRKERKLYQLSDYIGVMSKANKDFVLNEHPKLEQKLDILPNAISINSNDEGIISRAELGLPIDDVLFLYGGNIGKPQSPSYIIECINQMENIDNAKFIICGWGAEAPRIINYIKENNVLNTIYLGSKDVETFNKITKASDVGLIFLDYRFTIPNFPQRLLSYLDASIPVICATDNSTDIGEIAENNNFGFSVASNNSLEWKNRVMELVKDVEKRKTMGVNGKKYLIENYDVSIAYSKILGQIKE